MNEQTWQRREYDTWDEAFRALTPAVRQQSVRVAGYTQALYVQACALAFGSQVKGGKERMRGAYADLAYKCGMYHQLGKALVPPEYQILQSDFTDEEIAVYRKYTSDGRVLVANLQERGARAKEKRTGEVQEQATTNIPWLMIRESCEQHMERYDGSGYPGGRMEHQISPIAQIVGLAKELDRISAETKSESPFEEAYQTLCGQAGTLWSEELIEVLRKAKAGCFEVYNKYIHYTMTLPKTIPLVNKRNNRPMGLKYRPMVAGPENRIMAYEAEPWFGGIVDRPGETEPMEALEPMFKRMNLVADITFYLLYEAADAVLRMENCKLGLQGLLVPMMPSFYELDSQLSRFQQLLEDQPIPQNKLMLTMPESVITQGTKDMVNNVKSYLQNGVFLMLDDYHPENIPIEKVLEMGFKYVRFASELHLKKQTTLDIKTLQLAGVVVLGGNAESHNALDWLHACGVQLHSGPLSGVLVDEDELIRDCLLRER